MELSLLDQAATQLRTSRTAVIIIPEQPSSDALAGALGLMLALEKAGQAPRIVCSQFSLPANHHFLPKSQSVQPGLPALRDFVVSVDISNTKPDALRYAIEGDKLQVYITPKKGFYETQDITTSAGKFAYDTIITLDTTSLDQLGQLFNDNAEFFLHTPIINIDHRAGNTRFGHVNLVDVVASSVSEIIFELIKKINPEYVDEQVATSLLTGIVSKTKVFQSDNVTPRLLAIASYLVSAGARRDEIIRNLYQTKNIPTLQLWGRALATIQASPSGRVISAIVTVADLAATNGKAAMAAGVLDELMVNAPQADYYCLFVEGMDEVRVFLLSQKNIPETLPNGLKKESLNYAVGVLPKPLTGAQKNLLEVLEQA